LTTFSNEPGRQFQPLYDGKVFLRRPGSPLAVDGSVFQEITYQEALSEARKEIDGYRNLARSMLAAAATGVDALIQVIAAYASERRVSNVSRRPTIRLRSTDKQNRPELGWILEGPPTADGWIVFAALTIADGATSRGQTHIGQCGWRECGVFFKVRKTKGTPVRKYCDSTHQVLAHNADSTRRSRESRKRQAELKAARMANGPRRRRQEKTEK
jgi:hypothetical protein